MSNQVAGPLMLDTSGRSKATQKGSLQCSEGSSFFAQKPKASGLFSSKNKERRRAGGGKVILGLYIFLLWLDMPLDKLNRITRQQGKK